MSLIPAHQLAERAGVELGHLENLDRLGILDIDDEGNLPEGGVRRVRIVQALEQAGLPLESLSEALRLGSVSLAFIDTPSYERWSSLTSVSFQQLGEETGIPPELFTVIREAMGFARPSLADRLREDEMAVVP
jgi:hypothetical protein